MEIETPRLYIRNFNANDAPDLFELDTDPEVIKYTGGQIPKSIEDSVDKINHQIEYYESHNGFGIFPAVLKSTNEFTGWCALKYLDATEKIEVGYRLRKRFRGFGYATKLTNALLKYAFDNLNLKGVFAVTHPDNIASQNVLGKSGLRYTGIEYFYKKNLFVYKIENKINSAEPE